MAIMEGVDPIEKWKTAFAPAYKANLMVWPFVQGANFAFVPLELRVLVVNIVSLGRCSLGVIALENECANFLAGWNCFLSLMNSGEE